MQLLVKVSFLDESVLGGWEVSVHCRRVIAFTALGKKLSLSLFVLLLMPGKVGSVHESSHLRAAKTVSPGLVEGNPQCPAVCCPHPPGLSPSLCRAAAVPH